MSLSQEKVILWHSTSLINKDAILKNGIICVPLTKNQAKDKLKKFHVAVSTELGVKFRDKHYTLDRLLEASRDGCVVYLSDEKEYSMQNALASQEWKIDVIHQALKKKFPNEYKKLANLNSNSLKASRRWHNHEDNEMKHLPGYGTERSRIFKENLRLYDLRKEASNKSEEYARIIREMENKFQAQFFSTDCVVFKIELARDILSELCKNKEDAQQKYMQEICLTKVPREYIISFEEFNMEEWERARRGAY